MSIAELIDADRLADGLWWQRTITAVEGCTHVSPACDHCWAEAGANMRQHNPNVAHRHAGLVTNERYNGKIRLMHADILKPLRWRKPAVITYWNDVFHKAVPFDFIDRIMAVIALTPQHVHIICTKRPERMYEYLSDWSRVTDGIANAWVDDMVGPTMGTIDINNAWAKARGMTAKERDRREDIRDDYYTGWYYKSSKSLVDASKHMWPLPNLILMTTAEDQQRADERIPWLLKCPAACHSVAIEPMLDAVDLRHIQTDVVEIDALTGNHGVHRPHEGCSDKKLHWVILGGESGKGARPLLPTYVQRVRDHCAETGTPFLFKQWGEWVPEYVLEGETHQKGSQDRIGTNRTPDGRACYLVRVGKKAAGRLLDGRTHDGYPEVQHG